jgi:hypothetical protein
MLFSSFPEYASCLHPIKREPAAKWLTRIEDFGGHSAPGVQAASPFIARQVDFAGPGRYFLATF